jgi:hypothetical protein
VDLSLEQSPGLYWSTEFGQNSDKRCAEAVWSTMSAARRGYLSFMKEGFGQGHLDHFYETVEQRFLGDERFVNEVEKKKEREPEKIKVKFSRLVEGLASLYGIEAGRCWVWSASEAG